MEKCEIQKQKHILLCIVAMFWFAQYVYVPYQTPYLLAMQVSSTMVGTIIGAYGLSQLLLRMPVGIWADKRGYHKGFILAGVAASGIASLLRILLPDSRGFLIGNLLSGLASAMWISFIVLYIVAAVLSSYFAASPFAQRRGSIFWIPSIAVCLALYCLLIPNLFSIYWIYPVQVLAGMSSGILFSFCVSEAMRDVPVGKKSTAMGYHQAIYALGMTIFPVITGIAAEYCGLSNAFYLNAGLSLCAAGAAILFYLCSEKAKSTKNYFSA